MWCVRYGWQAWVEVDFGNQFQPFFGCPDLHADPSDCTWGARHASGNL
jgi:hypothetical protein